MIFDTKYTLGTYNVDFLSDGLLDIDVREVLLYLKNTKTSGREILFLISNFFLFSSTQPH